MAIIKKIIIADDNASHRTVLKSNLRSAGAPLGIEFELIGEADNGSKLLDLYKIQKDNVDLIFSDIRMPVMDGLSALVKIKHINPNQKIIMASSEDEQSMDKANAQLGEEARKTVQRSQRMDLLSKVAERIKAGTQEEGKTNSMLTGCEKLALDPVYVAQQYGASGYIKKPYDEAFVKDILQRVLINNITKFATKY